MRRQKYLYNFNDFVKVINANGKSYEMKYSDFRRCTKKVCKGSDTNYPKLQNILGC